MSAAEVAAIVGSLQRGLRWLKEHAESFSDPRDLAVTIFSLLCVERNPHSHGVERLTRTLLNKQSQNGSWSDEIWDTTAALTALHAQGRTAVDPPVAKALDFIRSVQDPIRGAWYEEPFETMLVLDAFAKNCPDKALEAGSVALDWLLSLQRPDGALIGVRYTGMLVSLLIQEPYRGRRGHENAVARAVEWLRADIADRTIWTAAAWSNYYPLQALLEFGAEAGDAVVDKAVRWFLSSQDADGKWMHVARVYDTALSITILARLLSTPLIDITPARTGIVSASRENGTIRVSFYNPPPGGAVSPTERLKVSEDVRSELGKNQQYLLTLASEIRKHRGTGTGPVPATSGRLSAQEELLSIGRYAYGHLIPSRIQQHLEQTGADHVRLDIDEHLIDLPWEIIHDGTEFLCLRFAIARRLVSDQAFRTSPRRAGEPGVLRVLVVSNPTGDLPAADLEGTRVAQLLGAVGHLQVDHRNQQEMLKREFLLSLEKYDIIHFAGHASHNSETPDESSLCFHDGVVTAFEIGRFLTQRAPAVVFLNACWSAEELRSKDSYPAMMRGLGRTFLFSGVTAFIGYLIPVPDDAATDLASHFYTALVEGQTIGESLRRARIASKAKYGADDMTWSSAIMYGEPSARVIAPLTTGSFTNSGSASRAP